MTSEACPLCARGRRFERSAFARIAEPAAVERLARRHPGWRPSMGACPSCLEGAREGSVFPDVRNMPLLRLGGYLVPPTPVRMAADPRYCGRGVTVAFVDSGFSLHPDLVAPRMRVKAYFDAEDDHASLAELAAPDLLSWHGTMTSVVATGSGFLSAGVYRGIASEADVVLVRVSNRQGRQPDRNIVRGLDWLLEHRRAFGLRIVNISLRGDAPPAGGRGPIERRVAALTEAGVLVVAASGNESAPTLFPPASCPEALTVGGLDDGVIGGGMPNLYHSNWSGEPPKPEVVAPALFVASPVLPGTDIFKRSRVIVAALHAEGRARRRLAERWRELLALPEEAVRAGGRRLSEELQRRALGDKIIAPYYHHAEGTSVAAPIVTSIAAQMLEAAPKLRPAEAKRILMETALVVPGHALERQGRGVVIAASAVAEARRRAR